MEFRIADTFTTSLARLTGDEQKAAKTTAFDLQVNPSGKGMSFHKLDRAKDLNFWSVRVSRDIRLIVHKTAGSLLLCYVDHHDRAYQWAERRKLEVHPTTGAAQLVEIRERVEEILVPKYVEDRASATRPKPKFFEKYSDAQLLAYGVPQEWLGDVKASDEDSLLDLADHLPGEAAEALLELATGGTPALPEVASKGADPFQHPDAQRRFRVMSDMDELVRALEYPWDKWTVFLHPAQRQLVERNYNGAARVSGSAGTGKLWWLCTALCIWHIKMKTHVFCFPRFPIPWPTRCAAICTDLSGTLLSSASVSTWLRWRLSVFACIQRNLASQYSLAGMKFPLC